MFVDRLFVLFLLLSLIVLFVRCLFCSWSIVDCCIYFFVWFVAIDVAVAVPAAVAAFAVAALAADAVGEALFLCGLCGNRLLPFVGASIGLFCSCCFFPSFLEDAQQTEAHFTSAGYVSDADGTCFIAPLASGHYDC